MHIFFLVPFCRACACMLWILKRRGVYMRADWLPLSNLRFNYACFIFLKFSSIFPFCRSLMLHSIHCSTHQATAGRLFCRLSKGADFARPQTWRSDTSSSIGRTPCHSAGVDVLGFALRVHRRWVGLCGNEWVNGEMSEWVRWLMFFFIKAYLHI